MYVHLFAIWWCLEILSRSSPFFCTRRSLLGSSRAMWHAQLGQAEMLPGEEQINPKKVGFHWPKGDLHIDLLYDLL